VSDTHAAEGRRPGRPPKDENEKRVPLSLRITPDLRSALEAAAKGDNRSLTQLSEFALASFLEARKHGHPSKDVSPAAPSPSTEKDHDRPARLERPLKHHHQRDPIDVFGRAFGRQLTAVMVLATYVAKEVLYDKKVERTWLDKPQDFRETTEAINALLRLISPHEDPALFARMRVALWGSSEAHPSAELDAALIVGDLVFEWGVRDFEPWRSFIRDGLGEDVVARIRQRLSDLSEG